MRNIQFKVLIIVLILISIISCDSKPIIHSESGNNCRDSLNSLSDRWKPAFEAICGRIEGTEIKNLSQVNIKPNSVEIRIWVGFDTHPLRGIILRKEDEKSSAFYVPPLKNTTGKSNKLEKLPSPNSGWIILWQKLEDSKIFTLPDSKEIGIDNTTFDNTSVVIEFKTFNTYRVYSYFRVDEIEREEPKRVLEICNTLSQEFEIDLLKFYDTSIESQK